ncbi:hypothetical protein C095_00320 [Fusobacterium necrophorum subsp. funduliforme B35]|uniref:Uncharacterized protein n=2 Tax=Fusobacterium necrophorum TaxID=859 RepID=A0A0B4ETN5_9FUSO|nr:hypothetical protein C095_00320 [Fusobacterium necrophorum subsp. funduliforme B35]
MSRPIIKFVKFSKKYKYFLKECRASIFYRRFINSSLNGTDIFIVIYHFPIGFIEINSINKIDSNLALNIFLKDHNFLIKTIVLFKSIGFVFERYEINKVILKVYQNNYRMHNILKK